MSDVYKGAPPHDHIGIGEEFIEHYGIMGMKWGVRRYQPYSQVPRKSGKGGTEKGVAKKKTRIGYDEDIRIPKGTKAYRIGVSDEKLGSRAYVTIDKNDRNMYKGMWPTAMRNNVGSAQKDSTLKEYRFKTSEDLISPSAAKRQKIASDLASDFGVVTEIAVTKTSKDVERAKPGITAKDARAFVYKCALNPTNANQQEWNKHLVKTTDDVFKDLNSRTELGKATLVLSAMGESDYVKKKYGEAVVKSGYNASIDDHGADFPGILRVNAPVIVYDPDRRLRAKGAKTVSKYGSNKAWSDYSYAMQSITGKAANKNYVPNVVKKGYGEDNYYKNNTRDYVFPNNPDMYKKKSRR